MFAHPWKHCCGNKICFPGSKMFPTKFRNILCFPMFLINVSQSVCPLWETWRNIGRKQCFRNNVGINIDVNLYSRPLTAQTENIKSQLEISNSTCFLQLSMLCYVIVFLNYILQYYVQYAYLIVCISNSCFNFNGNYPIN